MIQTIVDSNHLSCLEPPKNFLCGDRLTGIRRSSIPNCGDSPFGHDEADDHTAVVTPCRLQPDVVEAIRIPESCEIPSLFAGEVADFACDQSAQNVLRNPASAPELDGVDNSGNGRRLHLGWRRLLAPEQRRARQGAKADKGRIQKPCRS